MNCRVWIIVAAIGLWAAGSSAVTRYVVPPGTPGVTPTSPYTTWGTASTDLPTLALSADDVVIISNGVYYLSTRITVTSARVQYTGVSGNPADVVLSGTGAGNQALYIAASGLLFANLTISNFSSAYGCMYNGDSSQTNITFSNCVFTSNTGGGIGAGGINSGGTGLKVLNCIIQNNSNSGGGIGGGLYVNTSLAGDNTIISNCVFSGNTCSGQFGGGVGLQGTATSLIYNCIFSNNTYTSSQYGGGGYNSGPLVMTKCTFVTNSAGSSGSGGGWFINNSATIISNCDFINNVAVGGFGGGVAYGGGNGGTVANCRFIGNKAAAGGGLSFYYGKGGLVVNCVISNNASGEGGGMETYPGGGEMRNCLITHNRSTGTGGGIAVSAVLGAAYYNVINSCTVVSNTSTSTGGGIHIRGDNTSSVAITNSIVYFNTSPDADNVSGVTPTYTCCCLTNNFGGNNITNNPLFVAAGSDNYGLGRGSLCINAGTNLPWMNGAMDLSGQSRIMMGTVDIGAYEYVPPKGTVIAIR